MRSKSAQPSIEDLSQLKKNGNKIKISTNAVEESDVLGSSRSESNLCLHFRF